MQIKQAVHHHLIVRQERGCFSKSVWSQGGDCLLWQTAFTLATSTGKQEHFAASFLCQHQLCQSRSKFSKGFKFILFLFGKSCHAYRMCVRKDDNVCLNIFKSLKECCITSKEMKSLVNYADHSRVLQIKPLNWPAPSSMSCIRSTSQREQLWNYREKGLNILLELFVCHLRLWIKNQQGSGWRKFKKSYSMLKSSSETHLEFIFFNA